MIARAELAGLGSTEGPGTTWKVPKAFGGVGP
jgi:hypothetical protein